MQLPFGILNINKPLGITSRQVVNHVQRLIRPAKCGHAGTLDPIAGGVLIVCVGPATRLIQRVQEMPKRYVGTFLLGRSSPTDDIEGEVVELPDPPVPSREAIVASAQSFVGDIQQRPPAYSAIKVNGQRAYHLARRGETVELAARTVQIHQIDVVHYAYPQLVLDIRCGSGTYVRSLGRDVAQSLGTAAIMSELTRTEIGRFHLSGAIDLETIDRESLPSQLLDARDAVPDMPTVQLTVEEHVRIRSGLKIVKAAPPGEVAALDHQGRLVSICTSTADGQIAPIMNFLDPAAP